MRLVAMVAIGVIGSSAIATSFVGVQPSKPSRALTLMADAGNANMAPDGGVSVSAVLNIGPSSVKSVVMIGAEDFRVADIQLTKEIAPSISAAIRKVSDAADDQTEITETIGGYRVGSVEANSGWAVGFGPADRGILKPMVGTPGDARDLADRIDTACANIAWMETRVAALQEK